MNRDKVKAIAADAALALEAVAEKYGTSVDYRGGSFDSTGTFTARFEFAEEGHERAEFERYARSFGLDASYFGRSFQAQGREFTVTGINVKARKMPILAVDSAGRTFKFGADVVKRLAQ